MCLRGIWFLWGTICHCIWSIWFEGSFPPFGIRPNSFYLKNCFSDYLQQSYFSLVIRIVLGPLIRISYHIRWLSRINFYPMNTAHKDRVHIYLLTWCVWVCCACVGMGECGGLRWEGRGWGVGRKGWLRDWIREGGGSVRYT